MYIGILDGLLVLQVLVDVACVLCEIKMRQ